MAVVTPRGIVWTTATGAKTTASFTPAAGELLVVIAGIATSDTAPTITDTDATITGYTLVDVFRSQAATGGLRVYVSNQGASGSPITVTMTPTADSGGGLAVLSVTQPSAFGASAVRSVGGQADQAAAGTPAPVLSNTPLSKNPVIVAVMTNSNGTANAAPRTGYTEHYDQGFTTPATGIEVQSRASGETSATLTTGAAAPSIFAAIGIEVATDAAFVQPVPDAIAGTDAQAKVIVNTTADAASITDAVDPQLTAGAFSPTDIAGLQTWLKADAISASDGDPVTTWQDSHTSNNDATGGSPTYQTNEINGLPVVRFDGTDDVLTVAGITNNDATRTIFAVVRQVTITLNEGVLGWAVAAQFATSATHYQWRTNQAAAAFNLGVASTTAPSLLAIRFNSITSADYYFDAGSGTNFDPDNTYSTGTAGLGLGVRTGGTAYGNVEIAEVLVFDSALIDADLDDVRSYLLDKWTPAGAGHSQPEDDAATVTDAQTKAVASTKADAIAGTDARTATWNAVRSQPDAIAGTDAQTKAATHPIADAIAGTDARSIKPSRALADSAAGTDAQTRRPTKAQADTIAGTDARAKAVSRAPQADSIAGTDATARAWAAKLTVSDGLSVTDSVSTSAAGANERNVNDAATVTDAVARSTTTRRTVGDTIAGTDAQAKRVTRSQADSFAGTDARARAWTAKLTIADGISATDSANIGAAGAREQDVDDSATVTDAISVGHRRTLGDSLTATDARIAQVDYVRQPADVLAAADTLTRAWTIFEAQADGLTITDAVNARIPPARWPPATDEDWPADTDEDWEAQTDDRWLVSAESNW